MNNYVIVGMPGNNHSGKEYPIVIHLRDSFVLLFVSILVIGWVKYLIKPEGVIGLLRLAVLNGILVFLLYYTRAEYVLVPLALFIAFMVSRYLSNKKQRITGSSILLSIVFFMMIFQVLSESEIYINLLQSGSGDYLKLSAEEHAGTGSLGYSLIVNQNIIVRLVLGSIYLFIFPIPFWNGFQIESAYQLFKTCNVIYIYFILPLFFLGIYLIIKDKSYRTVHNLFFLISFIGFTLSVAVTSLENRHWGAFIPILLLICIIPDLNIRYNIIKYKRYFAIIMLSIISIHMLWLGLKVF